MSRFQIKNFVMLQVPPSIPMHTRPYEARGNGSALDSLYQTMDERTARAQTVTAGDLAGFASQILSPSARPEREVWVPNGWNEKRFRFLLEVECISESGTLSYVITGYTSNAEISYSGIISPEMDLFFNNLMIFRYVNVNDPRSGQFIRVKKLMSCNQIIVSRDDYQNYDGRAPLSRLSRPNYKLSMTPANVLGLLEVKNGSFPVLDTRAWAGAGTGVNLVNRRNNLASFYLAQTAQSLYTGVADTQYQSSGFTDEDQRERQIFSRAREAAQRFEPNPYEDHFLLALSRTDYADRGYVSFAAMTEVFGRDFDTCCNVVMGETFMTGSSGMTAHEIRFGSHDVVSWDSQLKETEIASYLAQAVPTMMIECLMAQVTFNATNMVHEFGISGCRSQIEVVDSKMLLADIDDVALIQMFADRFIDYIANDISYNDRIGYSLSMSVEMAGETRISIQLEGGHEYHYYTPSYCDNLFPPTLTTESDRLDNLAQDISRLVRI